MLSVSKARNLAAVLLIASAICPAARAQAPEIRSIEIQGVPRVKQLRNYCGPACLASVMRHYGAQISQESIGREVYDSDSGATNGADLLYFARRHGYAAYSWNTSIEDVKRKLSRGTPVIVLQQNSLTDTSGHYRILTGCDDDRGVFRVIDPYYEEITELGYAECRKLWEKKGFWALVVAPADQDPYRHELGAGNPVVHMDLAYAFYKRRMYSEALDEANLALAIQPRNTHAMAIQGKISAAMGAGKKPSPGGE